MSSPRPRSSPDKGIAGAKDWALATFSTLESQKAIEEDIASIKGSIKVLKASVADLEKRLHGEILQGSRRPSQVWIPRSRSR